MSSTYSTFACGEDEPEPPQPPMASMAPPPPRMPRRSTSGPAPPPFARHGWQGGKPPPGSLRQDIAARAAVQEEGDFSDDEDYLRGDQLMKRHKDEEKKRRNNEVVCICDGLPRAACPVHGSKGNSRSFLREEDSDEEEEEDDEEEWSASMPPPLPPSVLGHGAAMAPMAAFVAPVASASGAVPSNASELMGSAVREAFLSGIEQGKRMQLPTQCKTCAVRKERNRVAAKESRLKKRREAETVSHRSQVARAADVAASRATIARAAAGGGAADDEAPEPPPF